VPLTAESHVRASSASRAQAIAEYLDWLELERQAQPSTVRAYRADLERFREFAERVGELTVGDVDRQLVTGYQRHISRATTERLGHSERLGPGRRHRLLVSVRSFLAFAARERWLPGDLGAVIDLPKVPERLPKPLHEESRERLLAALPHETVAEKRDTALVLFLLSTGARIAEALRLDRPEWRPERMSVIGKGDKERAVVISPRCRAAVDDYLAARQDPSPALFIGFHRPTTAGSPRQNRLTADGARHVCLQVARRLGLPRFSPHVLRHTLGTLLQEEMGDARLTAEVLGHSGLGSVAGYTKVAATHLREGYRRMEQRGL
jgi:integrase/recombinase XerD